MQFCSPRFNINQILSNKNIRSSNFMYAIYGMNNAEWFHVHSWLMQWDTSERKTIFENFFLSQVDAPLWCDIALLKGNCIPMTTYVQCTNIFNQFITKKDKNVYSSRLKMSRILNEWVRYFLKCKLHLFTFPCTSVLQWYCYDLSCNAGYRVAKLNFIIIFTEAK